MRDTVVVMLLASVLTCAVAPAARAQGLEPIKTVTVGSNGELRVNGKPFIPLKAWLQDPVHFPKLREAGINTMGGYWWSNEKQRGQGDTTSMDAYAKMVREAGFYFIAPYMENQLEATGKVAKMDNLLAWIHNDEPDLPKKVKDEKTGETRSVPRDSLEQTAEKYRKLKALDQGHPVIMGFTANFMKSETRHYDQAMKAKIYPEYIKHCDGTGFDTYPIFGWNRPDWLYKVSVGVAELRALAGPKRFVGATIETNKGSKWVSQEKQLDVEPQHTRFEVWSALIQGATLISYFTHSWRPEPYTQFACTPEMVAELKRLNAQIGRLTPAIVASPTKRPVAMTLAGEGGAGELACHFKATELDGAVFIFGQNMDMNPGKDARGRASIAPRTGTATFTVEGLKAGTKVEVVDESRAIAAEAGRFRDTFAGLAEHIYRIPVE